eukprot:scaffold4433_cov124-Isochrysis_galbana.AAC.5
MRGGINTAAVGSGAGAGVGARNASAPVPALFQILLPASGRALPAAPSELLAAAVGRAAAACGLPADATVLFSGDRLVVTRGGLTTLGEAAAGCGGRTVRRLRLSLRAAGGGCSSSRVDAFASEDAGLSEPPPIRPVRFITHKREGSSGRTGEYGELSVTLSVVKPTVRAPRKKNV